jgi:putative membrane protein
MKRLTIRFIVTGLSLWATIWLIGGLEYSGSIQTFLGLTAVFTLVNLIIRPVAKLFALPFIILTLGVGALVINGLMFWLATAISGRLDLGLTTTGFWPSFWGAIVMGIVGYFANKVLKSDKDD